MKDRNLRKEVFINVMILCFGLTVVYIARHTIQAPENLALNHAHSEGSFWLKYNISYGWAFFLSVPVILIRYGLLLARYIGREIEKEIKSDR